MINYITVDGVDSTTKGLHFDKLPLFPMARRKFETYNVGRDESAAYALDEYEDIELSLTAYMVGGVTISDVYSWLHDAKTLTMSTQPAIYGKIKSIGSIQPDRTGWKANKIIIPLTLSPFKYAIDNPETELQNGGYVINKGTIFSRPVWRLYNIQSTVFLTVNGEDIKIDVSGGETVVIDTVRNVVYSGETVILDKTTGVLPLLNTGNNLISWTGDVDRVTLVKNERWV